MTASLFFAALLWRQDAQAQLKLGGNTAVTRGDAILELESGRKGLLLPRVTSMALTAPPLDTAGRGMMVFNITDNKIYIRSNGTWKPVVDETFVGWKLNGNASINPAINFLGTTDAQPLIFRTDNTEAARITSTGKFGVNTIFPHSHLHVNGSTATNVAVATGAFAMADSNSVVIMNNTAAVNFTLQNPANYKGRAIEIVAYNLGNVNFAGYPVRVQGSGGGTVTAVTSGNSVRLVSDGAAWVVTGRQKSGLPMYLGVSTPTNDGEVARDYNAYVNYGSGLYQTDAAAAPSNQIPNETAAYGLTMQTVGTANFAQMNVGGTASYFRSGLRSGVAGTAWQKNMSHPASIKMNVERLGTDSIGFTMQDNRNIVFSTNNTPRVRITGDGTTRLQTAVATNIKQVTSGPYTVDPTDYTIVVKVTGWGDDIRINLPDAATIPGRILIIRGLTQGNMGVPEIIIAPFAGDSINGDTSNLTFTPSNGRTANSFFTLQALDNNTWIVIAR